MVNLDVAGLASACAESDKNNQNTETVGTEILQYAIICALDSSGLLNGLRFRNASALRLCWGLERYSADLGFSTIGQFDDIDSAKMRECVRTCAQHVCGAELAVSEPEIHRPSGGHGRMTICIDVKHAQDVAQTQNRQIRIAVTGMQSHTGRLRRLQTRYPNLPVGLDSILIPCETREEIYADKLITFALSKRTRQGDIWDIPWLKSTKGFDVQLAMELVGLRLKDHGIAMETTELGMKGLARLVPEETWEGLDEYLRSCLTPECIERELDDEGCLDRLKADIVECFTAL